MQTGDRQHMFISVCLICMKYRIPILIIIIIILGQIFLSYIANTSRTHAHARTHTHRRSRHTGYRYSVAPNRDGPLRWRQCRSLAIEINTGSGGPVLPEVLGVFRLQKNLGRTETRTRDRMYCQTIRTVRDISQDDRARIATCSLRTPTDRQTDLRRITV